MNAEGLLVAAVATVGVFHTMVPDHWVPITVLARQEGWSKRETAKAALQAGTGHVVSTLLIAVAVWAAGVATAARYGHYVSTISSLALIGFGTWIAISSWLALSKNGTHKHHDDHSHDSPLHIHGHKRPMRMTLLIILGSSPMVEGIPAFFSAARYGAGLLVIMAFVFAVATIATYVVLCVYSASGLQRVRLGPFEKYGEVLSGGFIALVGIVFLIWPVL